MSNQIPHLPTPPLDSSTSSASPPILSLYNHSLQTNPDLPRPLAALRTLQQTLEHNLTTTTSELLSLLSISTTNLLTALGPRSREHAATKGATELFQRFVIQTLNQSQHLTTPPSPSAEEDPEEPSNFTPLRAHLLRTTSTFISNLTTVPDRIAQRYSPRFLSPSNNNGNPLRICTFRPTPTISTFLTYLPPSNFDSDSDAPEIDLTFTLSILTPLHLPTKKENKLLDTLYRRAKHFPDLTFLAPTLQQIDIVFLPATALLASGAIVGPRGILTIGIVAKALHVPVYVVAESWRCCRDFEVAGSGEPLEILLNEGDFEAAGDSSLEEVLNAGAEQLKEDGEEVLPAEYITGGLIMEEGVFSPGVVGEELVRMWY